MTIRVLKFGSSVLRREDDLPRAVHEIYRRWRRGERVVAVVSAFGNTTDRLIGRAKAYGEETETGAVAALLSTGEAEAAALLSLALGRSGLPAKLLTAEQAGLRTTGDPLDAEPATLDAVRILKELETSIVVVSGFSGIGDRGEVTLLGRGGSDLTALFLARELGAVCTLAKDVDGLYECDPADAFWRPRQFCRASFDTARRIGGGLVQPKALDFARRSALSFEISRIGAESGTFVGDVEDSLAAPRPGRPLKVALLGCGTVGGGVFRRMSELPEFFEITGVANLYPQKALHAGVPESLIARDSLELIERDNDVIVELIGGNRPARSLIEHALRLGRNVVTANKAVLADHRAHLSEIAFVNGVKMRYSAAVGGAMPALEFVTDAAAAGKLRRIAGIVNGTCNFICGRLAEGGDLAEAVKEAQNAGFAEADPTLDLNGTDSAQKIVLLARAGFGIDLELARIDRRGIEQLDGTTIKAAAERGQAVRLVAEVQRAGDGLAASVRPVQVPFDHPFAKTSGAENCLLIEDDDGKTTLIRGKGAGRFPTTEAVMADLFDIYRDSQYSVPANAGMKAFAGAGQ